MKRNRAIELLKDHSCRVLVGSLVVFSRTGNGTGIFSAGEITDYGTIYINELDYYEALWHILEIEDDDGKMKEVNWNEI